MATKKKAFKGSGKKTDETPVKSEKKTLISENNFSEYEHGQAWERGESITLAKDESE